MNGVLADTNHLVPGVPTRHELHQPLRRHRRFIEPTRDDYGAAADLSVTCRRAGVQLGSIDALIAQICIANDLTLLSADADFAHAAHHVALDVWNPA